MGSEANDRQRDDSDDTESNRCGIGRSDRFALSRLRNPSPPTPPRARKVRLGDRIFGGLAEGAGILIVVLIAAIGVFLLWRAIPALSRNEENFFTYGGNWITTDTSAMHFGILDLLQVTVFVSLFALVLAMPIALGIAIFLTQYSPRRLAGPLAYVVDLLAAVPSIVYGVWGLYVLAPVLEAASPCGSTRICSGCSCSRPAPRRWQAAAPSSPRASCWR